MYGCTTWTLTKSMKKKTDDNYPRMCVVAIEKGAFGSPSTKVAKFTFTIILEEFVIVLIRRLFRFFSRKCELWVECSPVVMETGVQSQVASYQRLLKLYLIPPCLTLSNIRYVSRVKWRNPGKGVAPSPTPQCSSY